MNEVNVHIVILSLMFLIGLERNFFFPLSNNSSGQVPDKALPLSHYLLMEMTYFELIIMFMQVLDVADLTIESVVLRDTGKDCKFETTNPQNVTFGSKLTITLGQIVERR